MIDSSDRQIPDVRATAKKPPRSLRDRIIDTIACVTFLAVLCYFQDPDFKRWVSAKLEVLESLIGGALALAMACVWASLAIQLYWPRLRPKFYMFLGLLLMFLWFRFYQT